MQHNVNCLVNSDEVSVLVREVMNEFAGCKPSEAVRDALVREIGAKINARFEVVPVIDDFSPDIGRISLSFALRKKGAGHG